MVAGQIGLTGPHARLVGQDRPRAKERAQNPSQLLVGLTVLEPHLRPTTAQLSHVLVYNTLLLVNSMQYISGKNSSMKYTLGIQSWYAIHPWYTVLVYNTMNIL